MRNYYMAEKLKNRHTSAGKLIWIMPLLVVFLAGVLTGEYFTIDCYNWWYTALFPGMTAFLCAAVGERDKKLGNRAILTLPADLGAVWDGKILTGIRCMGISLLVLGSAALSGSFLLERIFRLTFRASLTPGQQMGALLVLFVTSLWQIPCCLFLQQVMGTVPMVLLHMGSFVLCDVTLSLKPYFMILPGGIPARMMCLILKILPNGLPAEPGSMTYTPELMEWWGLPAGILGGIAWFVLFWCVSRKWFLHDCMQKEPAVTERQQAAVSREKIFSKREAED